MKPYAIALCAALALPACQVTQDDMSSHTVKVLVAEGHGSAVHIGSGYFVSAAHVIEGKDAIVLKDDRNREAPAQVLWANSDYDVALLRSNAPDVASADMECRTPQPNEAITLKGNPLSMEYITTSGRIAGAERTSSSWQSVVPVNATILPGMSGGGAFDSDGDLVGINVGLMVMRVGMGGGPSNLGYIVPAEIVCMLTGS